MPRKKQNQIDAKSTVEAAVDLPGVPAGTRGRVVMVTGLSWIRFRVQWENGADLGQLDASVLQLVD